MFLSKFAKKVAIVHRRDEFRASKIMLERARAMPNIEWLTPYAVEEFSAGDGKSLAVARLRDTTDGSTRDLEVTGAFIAVGHDPQSQLVQGQVETDAAGYVVTQGGSTLTGIAGVFAAGDLVDHTYRQAVTAAGIGLSGRARRRVVPARHAISGSRRRERSQRRGAGVRVELRASPASPSKTPEGTANRRHLRDMSMRGMLHVPKAGGEQGRGFGPNTGSRPPGPSCPTAAT